MVVFHGFAIPDFKALCYRSCKLMSEEVGMDLLDNQHEHEIDFNKGYIGEVEVW